MRLKFDKNYGNFDSGALSSPIVESSRRQEKRSGGLAIIFAVWIVLSMAGIGLLSLYSASPGKESHPPPQWPVTSTLRKDLGVSTLMMFVHPRCPCSQASISELALLLAHSAGTLRAQIIFLQPEGKDDSWVHADLCNAASKLPMAVVISDLDGREAKLFTASISGETMVYDAEGKLRFHGGITGARGHAGDNAGYASLQSYANGSSASKVRTPVFGCPLFDKTACETP